MLMIELQFFLTLYEADPKLRHNKVILCKWFSKYSCENFEIITNSWEITTVILTGTLDLSVR